MHTCECGERWATIDGLVDCKISHRASGSGNKSLRASRKRAAEWRARAVAAETANEALEATNAGLVVVLENMDKAFVSRHGCFPLDRTTPDQIFWNDAMTQARDAMLKARGAS